jgi:hypothetical protein
VARRSTYELGPLESKARQWNNIAKFRTQTRKLKFSRKVENEYLDALQKIAKMLKKRGYGKGTPVYDEFMHCIDLANYNLNAIDRAIAIDEKCIENLSK